MAKFFLQKFVIFNMTTDSFFNREMGNTRTGKEIRLEKLIKFGLSG